MNRFSHERINFNQSKQSQINTVDEITTYAHKDTDINSVFFQVMRKIGGSFVFNDLYNIKW